VLSLVRFISNLRLPTCDICNQPVKLETAKTDEVGKIVHEDYVRKMRLKNECVKGVLESR
jgi:hypothetical protein